MEAVTDFVFLGSNSTVDGDFSHKMKRYLLLVKERYDRPRHRIQKQRHHFADKGPSSESCGFSSSHVWMLGLDHKEAELWRIDAFELWFWRRLLRIPWTCKEIKPVSLKGSLPWTFIGRIDAEAEAPVPWLPDAKSRLTGKDPDAGKDWRQKE